MGQGPSHCQAARSVRSRSRLSQLISFATQVGDGTSLVCTADVLDSAQSPAHAFCCALLRVLQMVYSASSAADTMTAKAEASFSGYGVGVSAEFSKTESSSSQNSGIYFDYYSKKVFNPDPSNLKEYGELWEARRPQQLCPTCSCTVHLMLRVNTAD